jgi:hypothetical protein
MNWGREFLPFEFRGPNSVVWVAMEFEMEIGQNSEPNPPCVIPALHISKLPCFKLAGISVSVPLQRLINRIELDMAKHPHD